MYDVTLGRSLLMHFFAGCCGRQGDLEPRERRAAAARQQLRVAGQPGLQGGQLRQLQHVLEDHAVHGQQGKPGRHFEGGALIEGYPHGLCNRYKAAPMWIM